MKLFKKFWNDKKSVKEMNELKARFDEKGVMNEVDEHKDHFDFFVNEGCLDQLSEAEVSYCYFGKEN